METAQKKAPEVQKNGVGEPKKDTPSLKVIKKDDAPEKPQPVKTAATRIEKLETLNRLAKAHGHLLSKRRELTNFKAGNDGMNAQVNFSTSVGGELVTVSNAQVIAKLVEVAEAELVALLTKCETEINQFEI